MLKWIAMFILLWFIYQVRHVFPPIIVGAIIAYLLLPLVNSLAQRAKINIGHATFVVYGTLAAVIGFSGWLFIPGLVTELAELASHRHEIVRKVVEQVGSMMHWTVDSNLVADHILGSLTEGMRPTEIAHLGGKISHGALNLLVCVVSSIYFTIDSGAVGRFVLRYLPVDRREEVVELTGQANKLLSKYVQGQLLLILLMSTVAFLFLNFGIHVRYALPVAIISGTLEIIPVLGPILAIAIAVLVGIWDKGPQVAPIIIVFYTIARWIEDYAVVPKFIGHAVELHPLAVIFAVLCGEHLAGALGMLIAIPVAAIIKLFIDFFYFGRQPDHNSAAEVGKPILESANVSDTELKDNPVIQRLAEDDEPKPGI